MCRCCRCPPEDGTVLLRTGQRSAAVHAVLPGRGDEVPARHSGAQHDVGGAGTHVHMGQLPGTQ